MKRLRISNLMDEYTDTEFFPTGGSAVSSEAVKARVLASVKVQAKQKLMPRKKKLLIAAALAAALVLLVGAGYQFIQVKLVNGSLIFGQDRSKGFVENRIMEEEDGRLFFIPEEGQCVDITDLISEETPYIYDGSDPDAGLTYYIVMGGTPECYGWLTWINTPNPFGDEEDAPGVDNDRFTKAYHYYLMDHAIGGQTGHMGLDVDAVEWWDSMDHPWLLAGAEQLGIPFVDTPENVTVVSEK